MGNNERGASNLSDIRGETLYLAHPGEANTDLVLMAGRRRAEQLGLRTVVVPTDSGRSAIKAVQVFNGSGVRIIAVTTPPCTTCGPRGELPSGVPELPVRKWLREHGVTLVQGTFPFGGLGLTGGPRAACWPQELVQRVLETFGAGTKIAIQVTLMATDAGLLTPGEEVLAFGGTLKGLDTALVVTASLSWDYLARFEVLEVVAKPRHARVEFPEWKDPHWRGNLEPYYQPVELGPVGNVRGEGLPAGDKGY